jgi:GT2 family glycosyltransferase
VLNWNGRQHLEANLKSLLSLDYPSERLEVILCDNGSTDGSAEFVSREFPTVRVLRLGQNYGFALGNNMAAEHARSEWLGFLNNDVRVNQSWLIDLLSPLDEQPQLACLASRLMNWDGSAIDFIGGGVNFQGHAFQVDRGQAQSLSDRPRRVLFGCGAAMLIRRAVFEEVGGFDADYFAFFEDVDLGWRLNLSGYDVWYTPRATAFHRHHGTARRIDAHKLRVLYERNALFTIYKCFDDQNLTAALLPALLLLNERALRLAQLDLRRFRIPVPAGKNGATVEGYRLDVEGQPVSARIRRILREDGPRALLGKALRYVSYRGMAKAVQTIPWLRGTYLADVSASHFVALSEFGHALEVLNRKRRSIQERRVRSDAELLPLLHDPLASQYTDPEYLRFYRGLRKAMDLDSRFGPRPA